jgi:hypothetical protein
MQTMFTHKLDVSFGMLAVPFIGKASFRQIALSTTEANYIALSQALRKTLPMINLTKEINVIFPLYLPSPKLIIKIREDNKSCITMANNPKFSP